MATRGRNVSRYEGGLQPPSGCLRTQLLPVPSLRTDDLTDRHQRANRLRYALMARRLSFAPRLISSTNRVPGVEYEYEQIQWYLSTSPNR